MVQWAMFKTSDLSIFSPRPNPLNHVDPRPCPQDNCKKKSLITPSTQLAGYSTLASFYKLETLVRYYVGYIELLLHWVAQWLELYTNDSEHCISTFSSYIVEWKLSCSSCLSWGNLCTLFKVYLLYNNPIISPGFHQSRLAWSSSPLSGLTHGM